MAQNKAMLIISCLVILLVTLPYLAAFQVETNESVFGGFLINIKDGHSYLAKMQQGYLGNWKFVLPYTAEAGEGAYLFLFYLVLGHIARVINLPLIVIYHLARVLSAVFLLWAMSILFKRTFSATKDQNLGFMIASLGSGIGWIAVMFGLFTSDFWVAEAFPFLSIYTNPHFALGLGLMILGLIYDNENKPWISTLLGLALGIVQPFAVVIILLVLGGKSSIEFLESDGNIQERLKSSGSILRFVFFGVGGGIILLYQYWSILSDPVLALWNKQNVTSSPALLDLLLSLSPCLILAVLSIREAWNNEQGKLLLIWAGISLILICVPWNLQRRFLTGIFIPLAGLSVYGVSLIRKWIPAKNRILVFVLFCLILPTNGMVLMSGVQASTQLDPKIYIPKAVQEGLDWLSENSHTNDLVLADEVVGLYIPSATGRRVIYGHPFETVNADQELELVRLFFQGQMLPENIQTELIDRGVKYIFSTNELNQDLASWINQQGFAGVFKSGKVQIFLVTDS
ncbi:MAG: hypothetical protein WBB69_01440 [Anaerolineales bacterium]